MLKPLLRGQGFLSQAVCSGLQGPAFGFTMSVPPMRRLVSARLLTRALGGRLGVSETQVLSRRHVSSGLTKPPSVPALGGVIRRPEVATNASGSLYPAVRGH